MKRKCPLCRGEAVKDGNKFWPLCSERCSLIDLGKWFGEEYRIEGEPDPEAHALIAAEEDPER